MFTYCPKCKDALKHDEHHCSCDNCGFDYYFNTASAAGAILVNNERQIYLGLRSNEPKVGFWGLPGGYVKIAETAEEAVVEK